VPEVTLQSIVTALEERFISDSRRPTRIHKALDAIIRCRTGAYGSFKAVCSEGHIEYILNKSCWHRSCRQCSFTAQERWTEHWRGKMLDVPSHHVVNTTPGELRGLWVYNRRVMGGILMRAASHTIIGLMGEEKFCGGVPGVLTTLHTWGQGLQLHPHAHSLVTAGGLCGEEFLPAKKRILLPNRLVSDVFRDRFLDALEEAFLDGRIKLPPNMDEEGFYELTHRLREMKWKSKVMERYDGYEAVLGYLGRYMRGGPISNARILGFDDVDVTFSYKDNRVRDLDVPNKKIMVLDGMTFMERFFEHVPEKGFQGVRGYGVYANAEAGRKLLIARKALGQGPVVKPQDVSLHKFLEKKGDASKASCPVCKKPLVYVYDDDRFSRSVGRLRAAITTPFLPRQAQAP
jgi:hypothetical protein